MIYKRRQIFIRILQAFDMGCLLLALLLVVVLTSPPAQELTLRDLFTTRVSVSLVAEIVLFMGVWHVILCSHKLYISRRLSSITSEVADVMKALSVGTLILFLFSSILSIKRIDRNFLFTFWVNINGMTITGRMALRYLLRQFRRHGMNIRNILIAGAHNRGMGFAREIKSRPELGYRLVGFVDAPNETSSDFRASSYERVTDFDGFAEYLRTKVIDEVIICLPIKSHYQQAAQIAATCEEHGVLVRFLSDIFNPRLAHAFTQQFEGHSIITFYTGQMTGGSVIVKRMIDFTVSLVLLVLLSPLFLVVALLTKLSSPGPVFFTQKRLGLNKRRFSIYKFRTMHEGAERRQAELEHLNEMDGAVFKIKNDPRVTPVGRLLRKTNIDELPQLINVLKGEMSLVGPRPLPIRDYEGFNKDWHRRRFSVRPGITCLWQIGGRNGISFDRWMELDMEYIDNWSLWLDFKILLKTIPAVLKGSGAA